MAIIFSKACIYAIKATVFVAQKANINHCIGVKEIAKGINAPAYFIAKILQELNKKRFLVSVKGPNGGFYMTAQQKTIPIIEIVKQFDGTDLLSNCILGLDQCSNSNPCPMHTQYMEIRKGLLSMLEQNTIADFNNLVVSNQAFLKM